MTHVCPTAGVEVRRRNDRSFAIVLFFWIVACGAPLYAQKKGECFNEAIGDGFRALADAMIRVSTAVIPHGGVGIDGDQFQTSVAWPLTVSFAPEVARSISPRRCREPWIDRYLGSRAILEPEINVVWRKPVLARFALRAGYRFMLHRAGANVGWGAGLGTRFLPEKTLIPSLSPEVVVQIGECCSPSFLNVAVRYDRYFDVEENAVSVTFGWAYD